VTTNRSHVAACLGASAVVVAFSMGTAEAQQYPREVVVHCAQVTDALPELKSISDDAYRDRVRWACEANGGSIPGTRFPGATEQFDTGPTAVDRRAQ
jgi:hypothetical protein